MDELDRAIVNGLQQAGSFPVCERPFAEAAAQHGISEQELIGRVERLLRQGVLSRFGPMYHAERMGGRLSLAAMKIPVADFERVTGIVNAMPEVAHNYARDHVFSMWFVLATETLQAHAAALRKIELETGYPVYDMPKIREYFVGLVLRA